LLLRGNYSGFKFRTTRQAMYKRPCWSKCEVEAIHYCELFLILAHL